MSVMIETNLLRRFLPVHVINPRANRERSIDSGEELESLIDTFGGEIVDRVIQKLNNPDNSTFVGKGKVLEVAKLVEEKKIDVVVLNSTAKPRQLHNLKTALQKVSLGIEVWDRVDLILHIFEKNASTKEAKLQIELARMRYMGPRIYGMGMVLSRQGGGIGTLGIGETNTELMKRHWRSAVKKVTEELAKLNDDREKRIERRKREGYETVSIVGYTNAGKSSLFNLLTKKDVLVKNALFATLDSAVGEMYIPKISQEIIITDTIGFIRNLPPRLVQSFKSTLMETIHADIILHLVDASDPEMKDKIIVVEGVLKDLGIEPEKVLTVFNKVDGMSESHLLELKEAYRWEASAFISVKDNKGLDELIELIIGKLRN